MKDQHTKSSYKTIFNRIFSEIRESLRGEEKDYTTGNIKRAIFLLSVPMVLEMLMESVFAVVDIFFVSKLGADAIATVGITESVITLIYALAIGLSVGTSALVSRRIGEKDPKRASSTAWQAILTGVTVALIIAIPGYIFASDILRLMGASDIIVHEMSGYMKVMLAGNASIMLLFVINGVFRSAGDAVLSMRVLWVANGINIILDPMLIFGIGPFPELGVMGAAVATTTGRGIAVIYQIYLLRKGRGKIKLKGINFAPVKKTIGKIINLSLGSVSQYLVATSSWVILMTIISIYGSEAVAGYTIAIRIVVFALLPAWGISNAAATLVGQNLGAHNPSRAEKSVWITGRANMIFMGSIGLILAIWTGTFIEFFTEEIAIVKHGINGLRIMSIGFLAYGLGMVMVNAINGAGDTRTPLYINLISFWMIEIPLAWFLAQVVGWEMTGVFIAIISAETVMTLLAWLSFRSGRWKLKKV